MTEQRSGEDEAAAPERWEPNATAESVHAAAVAYAKCPGGTGSRFRERLLEAALAWAEKPFHGVPSGDSSPVRDPSVAMKVSDRLVRAIERAAKDLQSHPREGWTSFPPVLAELRAALDEHDGLRSSEPSRGGPRER